MKYSIATYLPGFQMLEYCFQRIAPSTHFLHFFSSSTPSPKPIAFKAQLLTMADFAKKDKQALNDLWNHHLQFIQSIITDPKINLDGETKIALKKILSELTPENIETFFHALVEASIVKDNLDIPDKILELIPLDAMLKTIQHQLPEKYPELDIWMRKVASLLPTNQPIPSHESGNQDSRNSNVVTRFFPNLTHIFFRAFDLFDAARPPDTLYEYGVLVTLYFNFFKLPYYLIQAVGNFAATPLQVLIISAAIMAVAIGMIYIYLRWLKKCPDEVIYCTKCPSKNTNKVLCRDDKYAEAQGCFGKGQPRTRINLAIIGEPGVGKTTWMNGLAARYPNIKFFAFKNWVLFNSAMCGVSVAEKINQAFKEVRFHEHEVAFCLDELGDAFKSKQADLAAVLKPVLDNKRIQFIAFLTHEQWKDLKQCDKSFEERFRAIYFQATDDNQTERILGEYVSQHACNISISRMGLQTIIKETNKNSTHSQPRKSVSVLWELINRIHQFDPASYSTPELREAQIKLDNLCKQPIYRDSPLKDPSLDMCKNYLEELEAAEQLVAQLTKKVLDMQNQAKECMRLLQVERHYQTIAGASACRFAQVSSLKIADQNRLKKQFIFANFFALKKIEKIIDRFIAELPKDMFVCLNEQTSASVVDANNAEK